jgi:hypothetical protein
MVYLQNGEMLTCDSLICKYGITIKELCIELV